MKKKLLAVMLSIAMISTSITVPAAASEAAVEETSEAPEEEGEKAAEEEQDAGKQEEAPAEDPADPAGEEAGPETEPGEGSEPDGTGTADPAAGEENLPAEEAPETDPGDEQPGVPEEPEIPGEEPEEMTVQNDAMDAVGSPEYVTSGVCGENLTWTVTETGSGMLLVISGTGDPYEVMEMEYSMGLFSWYAYHDKITEVRIENGVTSLGIAMFLGMTSLKKVTLPGTIQVIPGGCFSNCTALEQVILRSGLTEIEDNAFSNCRSLKKLVLPGTVTAIRDSAFYNCGSLNLYVPDSVESLGNGCIEAYSVVNYQGSEAAWQELTSTCYISDTVTVYFNIADADHMVEPGTAPLSGSYGDDVSWELISDGTLIVTGNGVPVGEPFEQPWEAYANRIRKVVISEGITEIPGYFFSSLEELESVSLPGSLMYIGDGAFSGVKLKNVVIPESVSLLGAGSFTGAETVVVPSSVTSIGSYVCSWDSLLIYQGTEAQWQAHADRGEYEFQECVVEFADGELVRVTGLSLNHHLINMEVGERIHLEASLGPENATCQAVEWKLSEIWSDMVRSWIVQFDGEDSAVTSGGEGVDLVAEGVGRRIVYAYSLDGRFVDICNVTVFGIELGFHGDLYYGEPVDFNDPANEAYVLLTDEEDPDIEWSVDDPSIAEFDSNGVLTPKKEGYIIVTASACNGKYTSRQELFVHGPVELYIYDDFIEGQQYDLTEYIEWSIDEPADPGYQWSSSDPSIAVIDENGILTAISPGVFSITVSACGGEFESTARFCYVFKPFPIRLNDHLCVGDEYDLTYEFSNYLDIDRDELSAAWSSSDPSVAEIIDNRTLVIKAPGTAVISLTVALLDGSGKQYTDTLEMKAVDALMGLRPFEESYRIGENIDVSAHLFWSNTIPYDNREVSFTLSDPAMGDLDVWGDEVFDENGDPYMTSRYADLHPLKAGDVTLTITSKTYGYTASALLHFVEGGGTDEPDPQQIPELSLVAEVPDHDGFHTGYLYYAQDFVRWSFEPEDEAAAEITWSCSDPEKAIFDDSGYFMAAVPGTVTLTATAYGGAVTASVDIDIYGMLRLQLDEYEYCVGDTLDLSDLEYWDDDFGNDFRPVVWSVDDPAVAVIEGTMLTFVGEGGVELTVSSEDGITGDSIWLSVTESEIIEGEYWTLDLGHRILTVSRTGRMPDFEDIDDAPWSDHRDQIETLIVEEGVESIGSYAFADLWNLREVTLPSTLTAIGSSAFIYCGNLESVIIPEGVTLIDANAFTDCWSLKEVLFPSSLREIGAGAFSDTALRQVVLPEGLQKLGEYALTSYDLWTITIPAGLETVEGDDLVWNRDNKVKIFYEGSEEQFLQLFAGMIEAQGGYQAFSDRYLVYCDLPDGPVTAEGLEITVPEEILKDECIEIYEWGSVDLDFAVLPENTTVAESDNLIIRYGEDSWFDDSIINVQFVNGKIRLKGKQVGLSGFGIFTTDGSDLSEYRLVRVIENPAYDKYKYNIAFKPNGGSGKMTGISKVPYRKVTTLPANKFTRKGYQFQGWTTKADGSGDYYASKAKVKCLTNKNGGTVNLYAVWEQIPYSINYKLNGGVNNVGNPYYYTVEQKVTLKTPTRENYTFAGWYSDKSFKKKVTSIAKGSTGGKTFYAKWVPNKYSIAFKGNGATGGKMSKMTGIAWNAAEKALTANAFTRKGYTFTGWNTEPDGSGTAYANKKKVKDLSRVNGATITLYAQWRLNTYKISYVLNSGAFPEDDGHETSYTVITDTFSLKSPVRKGYTFSGWYSDKKFKTKVTSVKKGTTGNKTFYAKWTANKYTIVFDKNGGTSGTMKNKSMTYGASATALTANAYKKKGYSFKGWNTEADGSGTAYTDKQKVKNLTPEKGGKVTLYAQWKQNTYKITYNVNKGIMPEEDYPTTFTVDDDTITLPVPTREGYTFAGWYTDSKFKSSTKATVIAAGSTGSKTYYAKWTKSQ